MDSHTPLTAAEIENLKMLYTSWEASDHGQLISYEYQSLCRAVVKTLPRLLSMLTPPTDAALLEAVDFSADARCGRLARGILRIGKKLRVMRADMASQTDALIAAIHAINGAGILMPDEVLNFASTKRAVQAPRLTAEQVDAVKIAGTLLTDTTSDYGDCEHDVGHCICKYKAGIFNLRAAFPGVCEEG